MAPATNLPFPPTPLIGREIEIRKVKELLDQEDVHLITLTGPGGSGKTRLGIEIASSAHKKFRDGVFFVDLAAINDSALVLPVIAQTINMQTETLKRDLPKKELLLMLDNFEHLMDAALIVPELITGSGIKILVTSREALHLRGEHELPVLPLPLPASGKTGSLTEIETSPAIRLFVERVKAIDPGFKLDTHNAWMIAEICRKLDGLPLAIELAAGQMRMFPPATLLDRLGKRLPSLSSGPRDLPARQKTLRATLDWSYKLLVPNEQRLLARLSVCGGASLEMVQAVTNTGDQSEEEFLAELTSLVEKNLLRQANTIQQEPRFFMLEIIREYAAEKLEIAGEMELFRRRHASYFLKLAEEADALNRTPEQANGLNLLRQEQDNLREALNWTFQDEPEGLFLHLVDALWRFWSIRGPVMEGRAWLQKAVDICHKAADTIDPKLAIDVITSASELARNQNDFETALDLKFEALELCKQINYENRAAATLHDLAVMYANYGDTKASISFAEEAVALRRKLGSPDGLSHALEALYFVRMCSDQIDEAQKAIEEMIQISSGHSSPEVFVWNQISLLFMAARQGEYQDAYAIFENILPVAQQLGDKDAIATTIYAMATVLIGQNYVQQGTRLLGVTERITSLGEFHLEIPGRMHFEQMIARAKAKIGEKIWLREYDRGKEMFQDASDSVEGLTITKGILSELEELRVASASETPGGRFPAGLTSREVEILKLVSQGLTDQQVAKTLVLSPRTVNAHLTSIYNKLGVNSRMAATRYAMENGLV